VFQISERETTSRASLFKNLTLFQWSTTITTLPCDF